MLVKNSLIYGATAALSGLFAFLVIAVYTRMLSPGEYGHYSVAVAIITFTDAFVFLWVRQSILRHVKPRHHKDDAAYLANAFLLYSGLAAACILLAPVAMKLWSLHDPSTPSFLYILGLLSAAEAASNLVILLARVRLRHNAFFILTVLKPGLTLGLGVILVKMGYGVAGALYGMLASLIICIAVGTSGNKEIRHPHLELKSRAIINDILAFGLPLVLALSIQSAIRITDIMLIGAMLGLSATGLYAAAQDLPSKILMLLMSSIHLAAYPLAAQALDHEGVEACRTQLRSNFTLLVGLSLPAAVGLAVLSPLFAHYFVGPEFRGFVGRNMGWFVAISFMNSIVQYYFILAFNLSRKNKSIMLPFIGAWLVNLAVGYVGIRMMGIMGAAVGSFTAYAFLLTVVVAMSRRVFPLPIPWKNLFHITVASLAMACVVFFFEHQTAYPLQLVVCIFVGALTYAGVLYGFNTAHVREELPRYIQRLTTGKARAHAPKTPGGPSR